MHNEKLLSQSLSECSLCNDNVIMIMHICIKLKMWPKEKMKINSSSDRWVKEIIIIKDISVNKEILE